MVQSLVMGVDIGHHSIKAVVLKPAGSKYTLLGYKEIRVADDIFADNHALVYQKIVKKNRLRRACLSYTTYLFLSCDMSCYINTTCRCV